MTASEASIIIIGIGNEFRGDDGSGIAVARLLRDRVPPVVRVLEASGEGAALMDAWQNTDTVFLVDAVRSQAEPGTVYRFDVREETLPTQFFHYSTHAFSVAEAVELARALGQLPPRMIIYGIEGETFETGKGCCPEVERAVETVVERIVADVERLFV